MLFEIIPRRRQTNLPSPEEPPYYPPLLGHAIHKNPVIISRFPPDWCIAKSILIHKKDDPASPSNFCPIALTSCIGKLFHKILSRRLEKFLVENGVIDTSVQKGFVTGINGVLEHILSTTLFYRMRGTVPMTLQSLSLI